MSSRVSFVVVAALSAGLLCGCDVQVVTVDADVIEGEDALSPDLGAGAARLAAMGADLVEKRGCAACHDPGDGSLSGQTLPRPGTRSFGANLTPDEDTGLGTWTDDEIVRALRGGVDDQRQPLCPPMPQYRDLGDGDAAAIVAFLRALPSVRREIPASECPPIKSSGDGARDGGGPEPAVTDAAPVVADAMVDASPADAGMPADLAGHGPPRDAGPVACAPRVNEIQTAGVGGAEDEFVEIYNPCADAIDLTDFRLAYRSSAGATDVTFIHFDGVTLAPARFVVCGQSHYSGKADFTYKWSMASTGGGVALRNAEGNVVDGVGWGDATNAFLRGRAAPAPAPGRSLERVPDGHDTGDNLADFHVAAPTPGAPNR